MGALPGCIEDPARGRNVDAGGPPTTFAPAPSPVANESLGAISGKVVDDEQVPIPGATITLVESRRDAISDAAGRFTFNDVSAGNYRLVVTRSGFENAGQQVTVAAGEIKESTIIMRPIEVPLTPYNVTVSKVAHLKAAWVYFTNLQYSQGVDLSTADSYMCDPCKFVQHHEKHPKDALTEALWRAGTTAPVLNNKVWITYNVNATDADPGGLNIKTGYWANRQAIKWSAAELRPLTTLEKHQLWVQGDLLGVNVEHKVEVFTTFSYHGPLGDSFSALPPP